MVNPTLDETTKAAINALTEEETSNRVSYAYKHEILAYGIDAVAHVHLMQRAKDVVEGKLAPEDFIEKYGLEFGVRTGGFDGSLSVIESDGVLVPKHAYWNPERKVGFFKMDYKNMIGCDAWQDKDYAWGLVERAWGPSDLQNPDLVEQGIRFGRDLWRTSVAGFHQYKCGDPEFNEPPQPKNVTELAEKLIAHYDIIVNAPNP